MCSDPYLHQPHLIPINNPSAHLHQPHLIPTNNPCAFLPMVLSVYL